MTGSDVCPFLYMLYVSILERSGENGSDVLVYFHPVCFMVAGAGWLETGVLVDRYIMEMDVIES